MRVSSEEDLAKLIKSVRKKVNLTQTQLAAACGVGVRFIVDLEKAKKTCQIAKTLRVVAMLGIKLEAKPPVGVED